MSNYAFLSDQYRHKARYAVLRGGTRSGKTYASLYFILFAGLAGRYNLCSVVAHSVPHLRRGAQRDWEAILKTAGVPVSYNATTRTYRLPAGNLVEFFSADDSAKLRGAQRDWLFINEVNLISQESFSELDVRTKEFVIVDFNPTGRFWLNELFENMGLDLERHTFVSTYRDNPFLSPEQIAAIEARKSLSEWWRVYGEGQWGSAAGQAWYAWTAAEVDLAEAWDVVGVDFGEGRAPHAVVGLRRRGEELEAAELYYAVSGIGELAGVLQSVRAGRIVGDPAQMDYINLLRKAGINIYPARKMQLVASFALLNKYNIRIWGKNLINEASSLSWADRAAGLLKVGQADHAVDALRYALHVLA